MILKVEKRLKQWLNSTRTPLRKKSNFAGLVLEPNKIRDEKNSEKQLYQNQNLLTQKNENNCLKAEKVNDDAIS